MDASGQALIVVALAGACAAGAVVVLVSRAAWAWTCRFVELVPDSPRRYRARRRRGRP